MTNDTRDPVDLGETLFRVAQLDRAAQPYDDVPLSDVYDRNMALLTLVPAHAANPSTLEKYGDPRARHTLAEAA